jgi:hypothetical protein
MAEALRDLSDQSRALVRHEIDAALREMWELAQVTQQQPRYWPLPQLFGGHEAEVDFTASRTASRALSMTAANGPASMLAPGVFGVDGWGRVGAAFLAAS